MAEETIAEENTESAGESQDDSSDNKDVTSPADETLLTEEDAADQKADDAEDTDGDDADSDGEAEPVETQLANGRRSSLSGEANC